MLDRRPPYQTYGCRRFQQWVRSGVFENALHALADDLRDRGSLDVSECHIDATFAIAQKGGEEIGATKRGEGTKVVAAVTDGNGLPIVAINIPHLLLRRIMKSHPCSRDYQHKCFVADENPRRASYWRHKEYDSDPLDYQLAIEYGIEMIAPHALGWGRRDRLRRVVVFCAHVHTKV